MGSASASAINGKPRIGGRTPRPFGPFVCCAVAVLLFGTLPVLADGRVALLIGNGGYLPESLRLPNPVNDVAALEQPLNRLGFDVEVLRDADRAAMRAGVAAFAERAKGAKIALFFFAGHAVQLDSTNYLLATSVPEVRQRPAIAHAIDTRELLKALLSANPGIGIVILNTSHDSPFTRGQHGGAAIAQPGLARHDDENIEGLLIAYATNPAGEKTIDGQDAGSAFTIALLNNIEIPGLTVRRMFRRVSYELPGNHFSVQEDVLGSHYLQEGGRDPGGGLAKEKELWDRALRTSDLTLIDEYEERYPQGLYASLIKIARDWLQRPPVIEKGGVNIEDIPPDQQPRLRAALAILGLRGDADEGIPDQTLKDDVKRYLSRYGRKRLDLDTLVADAGRQALVVGAALGKDISVGLRTLRAIEVAHDSARRELAGAEETVADHPHPDALLAEPRRLVASIQSMLEDYRRRVDQTWDLYAQLLERSRLLSLPAAEGPRTLVRSDDYEKLFRKHVQEQRTSVRLGTNNWLEDFR